MIEDTAGNVQMEVTNASVGRLEATRFSAQMYEWLSYIRTDGMDGINTSQHTCGFTFIDSNTKIDELVTGVVRYLFDSSQSVSY